MGQDSVLMLRHLLEERHSTRAYLEEEVAPDTINEILAMAQRTASWCNTQPWQVIVTRGEATRRFVDALSSAAKTAPVTDFAFPPDYSGVYAERRRESALQLYDAIGLERGDRIGSAKQAAENFRLFGAPHVAIVTTARALGVYGAIDCGAWVSNFMLAARAHGVASVAQAALVRDSQLLKGHFSIPEDRLLVCGISFGYSDARHPVNSYRTSRVDLSEAVRIVS